MLNVTFLRLEGCSQGRVVCCKPDDSMELAAKTRATIIAQILEVLLSFESWNLNSNFSGLPLFGFSTLLTNTLGS